MNQQKIGNLLRELRKQEGLTQEQFAERVGVSNRTVSRWENGNNLPDLDILIAISDDYGIDLRALLNGERKSEKMDKATEDTVLKAVAYTNEETERYTRRVHRLLMAGALCWLIAQLIQHTALAQLEILRNASAFAEGAACGLLVVGVVITSRYGKRLCAFKQRLLQRQ